MLRRLRRMLRRKQKPKSARRIGALLSVLGSFLDWCATHGLELKTVCPFHVAAWIEDFPGSKPTRNAKHLSGAATMPKNCRIHLNGIRFPGCGTERFESSRG